MSQYINRPSFKPGENKPICMKNVTPSLRKRKNGSTFDFIRPIGKTNDSPVARFIPEEFSNVTMFDEETSIGTNIKLVQKLDEINEALDNGDIDIIMAGRHMVKLLDKNVIFDSNVINISTQIASKLSIPNDPQEAGIGKVNVDYDEYQRNFGMVLLFMLAHTDGTVKEYDANGFIGSVNINKIPSKLRSGMILHLDDLSLQWDGSDDESLKSESDSDD